MAKKKSFESDKILKSIDVEQLASLHSIRGDSKNFKGLVSLMNTVLANDKDKIVGLAGGIKSVDNAVEANVEQSFYRGRISAIVLLHSLMNNAEKELERRERKDK